MSRWLLALWLSGAGPSPLSPASAPPGPDGQASDLSWMSGHWSGTKDGIRSEEHWTSPLGGALVGMHKDVKAGRMVSFEFLRIQAAPAGGLFYVASPRGAAPTSFALVERGPKRVVFANAAHDFPQRVLYWLDDAGALHARIEGPAGGGEQHEEWIWTRAR